MEIWSRDQLSSIDSVTLYNAQERGTKVHRYCTAYAKKLWTMEPEEEELRGYCASFRLWFDENVEELISAEERLYDDDFCFSGQYDMIVRLKDQTHYTLIDLKTSASYQKDWPVKLSAYLHLLQLNKRNVMTALSVRLKKDGKKPCVKDFGDCNPFYKIFLACLTGYDYFIRRNVKEVNDV